MRRLFIALAVLSLAACRQAAVNPDPNHTHADFAVWIDGQQIDFDRPEYMSDHIDDPDGAEPEGPHDDAGHKHPYLHLHDSNGAVVHRHKPGLTLGEFFDSIGMEMTATCFAVDPRMPVCTTDDKRWRMFVNGEEWPIDPTYAFSDLDAILLTYGSDDDAIAKQLDALTHDACLYSRTCPERGEPPAEGCVADPAVPCVAPEE
ncbi:MAG: protein-disulfide isomerase [Candidatus Peregrinibacteria bacterium Gr01-1014_25]|nr:MAG: protein-disulfide isomerase [Candidatus Peregrinibacteria bacterium Gr01-1014_25]